MDIASIAMNMSEISLANEVSASLMKMAMNEGKEVAGKMTEMISEVVDPNLGNIIDTRA